MHSNCTLFLEFQQPLDVRAKGTTPSARVIRSLHGLSCNFQPWDPEHACSAGSWGRAVSAVLDALWTVHLLGGAVSTMEGAGAAPRQHPWLAAGALPASSARFTSLMPSVKAWGIPLSLPGMLHGNKSGEGPSPPSPHQCFAR